MNNELLITFFSDPFYINPDGRPFNGVGGRFDQNGKSILGYTSRTIIETVLKHLTSQLESCKRVCHFIIKPHPLEHTQYLNEIIQPFKNPLLKIFVRSDESAWHWITMSDVIMGMTSIVLLEAALANKPTISIEIGIDKSLIEDPSLGNVLGYTYPVYDETTLRSTISNILNNRLECLQTTPVYSLKIEGSVQRVADVVSNINKPSPTHTGIHP